MSFRPHLFQPILRSFRSKSSLFNQQLCSTSNINSQHVLHCHKRNTHDVLFRTSAQFISSTTRDRLRNLARKRVYKDVKDRQQRSIRSRIVCFGWLRLGPAPVRRLHKKDVRTMQDWKTYISTTTKIERIIDNLETKDYLETFKLRSILIISFFIVMIIGLLLDHYLHPRLTNPNWWRRAYVPDYVTKDFERLILEPIAEQLDNNNNDDDNNNMMTNDTVMRYQKELAPGIELSPLQRLQRLETEFQDTFATKKTNLDETTSSQSKNDDDSSETTTTATTTTTTFWTREPINMTQIHNELYDLARQEQKLRDEGKWDKEYEYDGQVHITTPLFYGPSWSTLGILRKLKLLPSNELPEHSMGRFPSKTELQIDRYIRDISPKDLSILDHAATGFDPKYVNNAVAQSLAEYRRQHNITTDPTVESPYITSQESTSKAHVMRRRSFAEEFEQESKKQEIRDNQKAFETKKELILQKIHQDIEQS